MTSQEEAYASLQQKTTQQTAEATSLSQQSIDIEKKKSEAEALANTIREKQKAIEQRTLQNQSTLQMVSRQGGDVSRFNPLESASNKVAKMFEEKYVKLMPKSKNDFDEEDDEEYDNTKPPMAVSMFQ